MPSVEPSVASTLSPAGKMTLWAVALLAVSLSNHIPDVRERGRFERAVKTSDFMRLYVTGALADEGRWESLYDPAAHLAVAQRRVDSRLGMSGFHPNYGPTAAAALAPLSRLPLMWAWWALAATTVGVYLLAVWLWSRNVPLLSRHLGVVLLVAAASPALAVTLRYGQLSGITTALFLLAATFHRGRRGVAAGICIGLACYKPNLVAPAVIVFALARERQLLAGVVLGVVTHLFVGIVAGGLDTTLSWFELLWRLARDPRQVQGFAADSHSLHGFWRLLGAAPPWLTVLTAVGALLTLSAAALVWRRGASVSHRWAALALATLLASPHLVTYDLLLASVPLLLALDCWTDWEQQWRWRLTLAVALYLAPFLSPPIAEAVGVQYSAAAAAAALWLLVRASLPSSATPSVGVTDGR